MAENPDIVEPMEDLSIASEEVQVYPSVNYNGEKITDTKIESLTDKEIVE